MVVAPGSLIVAGYDVCSDPLVKLSVSGGGNVDFGSPQALTSTVERLFADGEIVSGIRTGNRTPTLYLNVKSIDPLARAAAVEQLARFFDQPTFQIVWTPARGGLPVVIDGRRGQFTIAQDLWVEQSGLARYQATFQAAPRTRTPSPVTLAPTVLSVQLDAFDTLTGLTFTPTGAGGVTTAAALDTVSKVEGTASVVVGVTPQAFGSSTAFVCAFTGARTITSKNLSSATQVAPMVFWGLPPIYTGTVTLTLTSASGTSAWTTSALPPTGEWSALSFDLTAPAVVTGTFALSAVTGWSLAFSCATTAGVGATATQYFVHFDGLRGYPAASGQFTNGSGLFRFDGIQGSGRAPASVEVDFTSGGASGGLLVNTVPDPPPGYQPILTPTSSGSTDTSCMSGKHYVSPVTYTIPAVSVRRPDAASAYQIAARISFPSALPTAGSPIAVTVTATLNGAGTYDAAFTQTITRTYSVGDLDLPIMTGVWKVLSLGEITLPPQDVDPLNTAATITLTIAATSNLIQVDQAWLIDTAGETVVVQIPNNAASPYYPLPVAAGWYGDAPAPGSEIGSVSAPTYGLTAGRAGAKSMDAYRTGNPYVYLHPTSTVMLVVVLPAQGFAVGLTSPTAVVSYYPQYFLERAV